MYFKQEIKCNLYVITGLDILDVNESFISASVYAKEPHHFVLTCYITGVSRMYVSESRTPVFVYAKELHYYEITSASRRDVREQQFDHVKTQKQPNEIVSSF